MEYFKPCSSGKSRKGQISPLGLSDSASGLLPGWELPGQLCFPFISPGEILKTPHPQGTLPWGAPTWRLGLRLLSSSAKGEAGTPAARTEPGEGWQNANISLPPVCPHFPSLPHPHAAGNAGCNLTSKHRITETRGKSLERNN